MPTKQAAGPHGPILLQLGINKKISYLVIILQLGINRHERI